MKKLNVIFLCTHNQARSQIAEVFLKKYAGKKFNVYSAGFEPTNIHPYTKKVMEEKGFRLSGYYSKDLKAYLGEIHFEIVITLCKRAKNLCPIIPGVNKDIYWDIEDPAIFEGSEEEKLEKFRETRDIIEEKIKSWLREKDI